MINIYITFDVSKYTTKIAKKMEYLTVGDSIKIKRTDGRVHGAVISKLNPPAKSVTVEWYERGETKGKEIELEAIFALNPELLPHSDAGTSSGGGGSQLVTYATAATAAAVNSGNTSSATSSVVHVPNNATSLASSTTTGVAGANTVNDTKRFSTAAGSHLSRNATHGAIAAAAGGRTNRMSYNVVQSGYGLSGSNSNANATLQSQDTNNMNIESGHVNASSSVATSNAMGVGGIMRSRTTSNALRLNSAVSSGTNTNTTSVVNSNATIVAINNNNNTNSNNIGSSGTANNNTHNTNIATTMASANTGAGNSNNNVAARRSYVVKEVERLKENREKRRARQAEIKEEKNALMNQDPGNPNWETAQMIREYQNTLEFNPLTDGQAIEDHQITVCVRKRPLSRKENNRKEIDVISVPRKDTLIVHEPRHKVDLTKFLENHKFRFDYAFDDRCDNAMVYK